MTIKYLTLTKHETHYKTRDTKQTLHGALEELTFVLLRQFEFTNKRQ